jgi:glycerol kinase
VSASEPLYIAIDQGGHATRAIVFDAHGREQASRSVAIETHRAADRVEHDPDALVASAERAVAAAAASLRDASGLCAAGLATQRSSVVCWDRVSGEALSPVISWQDRRAAGWLQQFAARERRVHELTGLVLSAHYGASKLRWCLAEIDAVRGAARRGRLVCGPLASFLLFRLTRERTLHADPCNASRTLLWDLRTGDWSDELLALFGLPREILPPCGLNRGGFGTLRVEGASLPVTVCTGDQPAALFACGAPSEDGALINAGTGAFLQCVTGTEARSLPGLLTSLAWAADARRCHVVEGTVNGAGSALSSVAQQLGFDPQTVFARLDEWCGTGVSPPLFLNGVGGLGAPYWVSGFQSRFVGEGDATARIVAVLESIAFLLQRNLDVLREGGIAPASIRLGGGLSASESFARMLADLSGLAVECLETTEATARGLAFLLAGEPQGWRPCASSRGASPRENAALLERYGRWRTALHGELARTSDRATDA